MNYKLKYLKYKSKYLNLKQQLVGGFTEGDLKIGSFVTIRYDTDLKHNGKKSKITKIESGQMINNFNSTLPKYKQIYTVMFNSESHQYSFEHFSQY